MKVIPTVIAAIIVMGIVVICLGIGWIITGKSRLRRGTCGMVPKEKGKKGKKKTSCSICGSEEKTCEPEKKNDNNRNSH